VEFLKSASGRRDLLFDTLGVTHLQVKKMKLKNTNVIANKLEF
jgi:hypothetical protein